MNIAIDYDGTYSADPQLFKEFIESAKSRGHIVKCLTMRYESEKIDAEIPCEIIYTSRKAKNSFWPEANIWIDDNPAWIFRDAL